MAQVHNKVNNKFILIFSLSKIFRIVRAVMRVKDTPTQPLRGDVPHSRMEIPMATKYFVKNKKVHKKPVPSSCLVIYNDQKLYDTDTEAMKHADEKCDKCFPELPQ